MQRVKDVDEYIAGAPKEIQQKLRDLRAVIREVAPQAEEKISYGMPYYGYKGRLVYFAFFKKHIGLYVMTPIVEEFKDELKDYKTGEAAIQFPLDKDFPLPLIKKLVLARVKKNDEKNKKI